MVEWIWYARLDTRFKAEIVAPSSPLHPAELRPFQRNPESRGVPLFRSGTTVARLEALHCPPVGLPPAVDDLWKEIILRFVSEHMVQFYPIQIACRDGISSKYSLVLPLTKVRCIDTERSNVISSDKIGDLTRIYICDYFVHKDGCLGQLHLARDEQMIGHFIISQELRDALAATGENSMFSQPEDHPSNGEMQFH